MIGTNNPTATIDGHPLSAETMEADERCHLWLLRDSEKKLKFARVLVHASNLSGRAAQIVGTDALAGVGRLLQCASLMRHIEEIRSVRFGGLASFVTCVPRRSSDPMADVAHLCRVYAHVFNGGDVAEVL